MSVKSQLIYEIESLPKECVEEVMDFVSFLKAKQLKKIPDTMLVSEAVLAKDWNSAEEDAAWENL